MTLRNKMVASVALGDYFYTMKPEIPTIISLTFILLSAGLALLLIIGVKSILQKTFSYDKNQKRSFLIFTGLLAGWLIFLAIFSTLSLADNWNLMPPPLLLVILPPLAISLYLVTSKRFSAFIQVVPQHWLVFIQSFRIIMELVLWFLLLDNVIPVQMTFEGRNYDVLTGILAIPAGFLVWKKKLSKKLLIAWNIFGLILLINIVVIAILSLPLPFRAFMNEPANTIVAYFPFIWLPGFVVPVAYTMHFISIKKALMKI